MAIGYLPLLVLRNNFDILVNSDEVRRLRRRYPSLRDFFNYFAATYLDGHLPPRAWNVHNRKMMERTNKFVECK